MSEYIERAALIAAFYKDAERCGDPETPWDLSAIETEIEAAPTADVAPVVYGRWNCVGSVCIDGEYEDILRCSKCSIPHDRKSRYCPNCGADMRGSFQNGNNHAKDWQPYMDLPRGRKDGEGNG